MKSILITLTVCVCLFTMPAVSFGWCYWDGGGSTDSWLEADNWSDSILPPSNDLVFIGNSGGAVSKVPNVDGAGAVANQINVGHNYYGWAGPGELTISAGNLTSSSIRVGCINVADRDGAVTQTGGAVDCGGELALGAELGFGSYTISGGSLDCGAHLLITDHSTSGGLFHVIGSGATSITADYQFYMRNGTGEVRFTLDTDGVTPIVSPRIFITPGNKKLSIDVGNYDTGNGDVVLFTGSTWRDMDGEFDTFEMISGSAILVYDTGHGQILLTDISQESADGDLGHWDGGGSDSDWDTDENWGGGIEPTSGTDTYIGKRQTHKTPQITQPGEAAGNLYVGHNTGSSADEGTLVISGGSLTVSDGFYVVKSASGSVGTVTQTGGAVVCGQELAVGSDAGSSGIYTISNGSLDCGDNLLISDGGSGLFHVIGSDVTNISADNQFCMGSGTSEVKFSLDADGATPIVTANININSSYDKLAVDISNYNISNGDVVLFEYSGSRNGVFDIVQIINGTAIVQYDDTNKQIKLTNIAPPPASNSFVPSGHPRVYLRPDDVNDVRAKILLPEFQGEWNAISSSSEAVCKAFTYLIDGNTTKGQEAVSAALSAIQTSTATSRWYDPAHWCACVYDWCYDLLTETEKGIFVSNFQRIAGLSRLGYPATQTTSTVSSGAAEGAILTTQLPAGVAIYDESMEMFDAAALLFFEKFIPVRNYFFPSHVYHQGDSYFNRLAYDLFATWLFRQMDAGDVISGQQQYVPYGTIYNRRPDYRQIRRSDTFDLTGHYGSKQLIFMLAGTYYEDPYLMTMADDSIASVDDFARCLQLIFRKPALDKSPVSELPLTKYFPEPMGEMVARTGWDMETTSDTALMFMRMGGSFFHGHQHRDMGTFQIYYKGPLATNSGIYYSEDTDATTEHYKNYYKQTLAHNGLLIFDPDEIPVNDAYRSVNDGGQRMPYSGWYPYSVGDLSSTFKLGSILSWEFGPDADVPEYSYISGEITNAYTDKVQQVTRSMVTLNLQDPNYPATLITFDRVESSDATFKKTWVQHSQTEPTVNGSTITVVNNTDDYAGKLVTESILPSNPDITKIGGSGYEFWVDSVQTNYLVSWHEDDEPGIWRVEVCPPTNQTDDLFLHVMTVMDDTQPTGPVVQTIDDANAIGARLLDRVVVFGKSKTPMTSVVFSVPSGGITKILVCDLEPGSWDVTRDGQPVASALEADEDGKCIYFEDDTGQVGQTCLYTLTHSPFAWTFADFDSDDDVDPDDLVFMTDQWLSTSPQGHPVTGKSPDMFDNGEIDFVDFAIFAQSWLEGVIPAGPPAALYEFEGNYNNSMGGSFPGRPSGDAHIVSAASGNGKPSSNTLSLDGSGDYVDFGNTSVPSIEGAITVACWVKTNSMIGTLVAKCYAWELGGGIGGTVRFNTTGLSNIVLESTTSLADGQWHHVAGVYDGHKKYIYIDGVEDVSIDCTGLLSMWDKYAFAAGALVKKEANGTPFGGFPKSYFEGFIDDVRVYDCALSPVEINQFLGQ